MAIPAAGKQPIKARHLGHSKAFPDIFAPFPDIVRKCPE